MRHVLVLGAAIALVGCGDPLADFETLSDVPLAGSAAPETPVSASPEAPIAEASDPPVDAPVDTAEAQPRSGFFGLLQRTRQNMAQAAAEVEAEGTQLAALADAAPEADSDEAPAVRATPVQKPGSTGWRLFDKTPAAFAATDVPFGTILPFGTVGRVCDARGRGRGCVRTLRRHGRRQAGETRSTGDRSTLYDFRLW